MRLEQRPVRRAGSRGYVRVAPDHVDSREHATGEHRRGGVDAGVEDRHGDAAPVRAREGDATPVPSALAELGSLQSSRGERRRIDRPDRVDAHDAGGALECRSGTGAEDGREAVERPRVDPLPPDLHPVAPECRDQPPLKRVGLLDEALLGPRRGRRLGARDTIGERGSREHDDHPVGQIEHGARVEGRLPRLGPAPGRYGGRDRAGSGEGGDGQAGRQGQASRWQGTTHMHRAQDSRGTGAPA